MFRPIIALDFDAVIHSYTSGWQGVDVIPDPPVPGVFEWMEKAMVHFDISIYSSRSGEHAGRRAMWDYIKKHTSHEFVRRLDFPEHKPRAFLTIDDRCIRFDGDWTDPIFSPEKLLEYKSWYQTTPSKDTSSS